MSNSLPDFFFSAAWVFAASALSDLLTALSFGVTFSLVTSATAWSITALWSLAMVSANFNTSVFFDFSLAMAALLMSIWLAVTATEAISGSVSLVCAEAFRLNTA